MGIIPTLALKAKNGYLCHEKRGSAPAPINRATLVRGLFHIRLSRNHQ